MNTPPNGGPAFPSIQPQFDNIQIGNGMSLRQWYAGLALQGILANEKLTGVTCLAPSEMYFRTEAAFDYADRMIAQGSKAP